MKKDLTLLLLIISLALVLIAVTFKANAQSQERTTASPIGGTVVKVDTVTQAKPGNPIGGIIVKGGHNGLANVQPTNPLYNPSGTTTSNPMYQGLSTGQPIGGIVVKGGQNPRPRPASSVVVIPVNSKSINEKGIK